MPAHTRTVDKNGILSTCGQNAQSIRFDQAGPLRQRLRYSRGVQCILRQNAAENRPALLKPQCRAISVTLI